MVSWGLVFLNNVREDEGLPGEQGQGSTMPRLFCKVMMERESGRK